MNNIVDEPAGVEPEPATISTSELQVLWRLGSLAAVRTKIMRMARRRGQPIKALGRDQETTEKLWPRDQVIGAQPGRGRRTDLHDNKTAGE